jgi:hypothetical protein
MSISGHLRALTEFLRTTPILSCSHHRGIDVKKLISIAYALILAAIACLLPAVALAMCPESECDYSDPQFQAADAAEQRCERPGSDAKKRLMDALALGYPAFGIAYRAASAEMDAARRDNLRPVALHDVWEAVTQRLEDRLLRTAEPEALQAYNLAQAKMAQTRQQCGGVPVPPRKTTAVLGPQRQAEHALKPPPPPAVGIPEVPDPYVCAHTTPEERAAYRALPGARQYTCIGDQPNLKPPTAAAATFEMTQPELKRPGEYPTDGGGAPESRIDYDKLDTTPPEQVWAQICAAKSPAQRASDNAYTFKMREMVGNHSKAVELFAVCPP